MALDVESEALVQQAFSRCAQDMPVLVIAHRLLTVRNFNNIAVIEHGGVSAQETNEELMEDSEGLCIRHSKPKQRTTRFTEVKKKTLNAIFEVNEKPPRETTHMISEHLNLKFRTVLNYFNRNRQRQLDLQRQQM
ncbi:unnamed protein product [Caenorhabditis nigoni]